MASIDDIGDDVRQLKYDVRAQGNILKLMLYSQATEFANAAVKALVDDRVLLELYIRVDGTVTKDEIVQQVVALNLRGGSRARVYSKLTAVEKLGLIEPMPGAGRSNVYKKSDIADGLRIDHHPEFQDALKAAKKA